ncbi:signal peptidase I [Thiorhodococcus mannitoliphagus]|uniref:Signal peptidase I n=1 Tax=Thiorhodococcus mannitoliphagus TaxID=329406 RepID=A0A6P1DW06_9GAMM|nr:signal peptidase I [Thiorhodococcus mannitoliphagus]NEX20282.1 signal peptidase I [Thiorhodococcus mannitoliphagus]
MQRIEPLAQRQRGLFEARAAHPQIRGRSRRFLWLSSVLLLVLVAAALYGSARYRLGIDTQARVSLAPYRVFLVDTWQGPEEITQGDLVAFRAQGLAPWFRDGQLLIKHALGVPGDWVTVDPEHTWINGMRMADGLALAVTLKQDPTTFLRHERVPVEHFWMLGETADSFDSRYWGFLPQAQVVGKAYALF